MPRKEEFRPTIALNNEPPNTPATPPLKENSSFLKEKRNSFFYMDEKSFRNKEKRNLFLWIKKSLFMDKEISFY